MRIISFFACTTQPLFIGNTVVAIFAMSYSTVALLANSILENNLLVENKKSERCIKLYVAWMVIDGIESEPFAVLQNTSNIGVPYFILPIQISSKIIPCFDIIIYSVNTTHTSSLEYFSITVDVPWAVVTPLRTLVADRGIRRLIKTRKTSITSLIILARHTVFNFTMTT